MLFQKEKNCDRLMQHFFRPPKPTDSRSVCPAMNAMANHGYIQRDGRNISIPSLIHASHKLFGLSYILAFLLTLFTMFSTGHLWRADLFALGRHNRIEHDASLVHDDTPKGTKYAPTRINPQLLQSLIDDASLRVEESPDEVLVNANDLARARVRREGESRPLDFVHSLIAISECALLISVFSLKRDNEEGIPLSLLVDLLREEKVPEMWRPARTVGLFQALKGSLEIKDAMDKMRSGPP